MVCRGYWGGGGGGGGALVCTFFILRINEHVYIFVLCTVCSVVRLQYRRMLYMLYTDATALVHMIM